VVSLLSPLSSLPILIHIYHAVCWFSPIVLGQIVEIVKVYLYSSSVYVNAE
jgi:hypothetical protein